MAQSSSNLAISLTLKNVGQVINGINAITLAWVAQGKQVTKNMLTQQQLMNQAIETQGKYAQAAVIASNKFTLAIAKSQSNASQLIGIIGNLTSTWTASGQRMTKSRQGIIDSLKEIIDSENRVAETAIVTGNKTNNQNKQNINSTLKWAISIGAVSTALIGVSASLSKVAGSFSVLGKAAGGLGTGIGGIVGFLTGGPAGAAAGGALGGGIGGILGNTIGAFFNIPFTFYKTIAKGIGTIVGGVLNGIKSIGSALNNLVFGPVSIFSLAMGSTFKNMLDGITQTIQQVWSAAEAFQQLNISIETLTRREIARSRGVDISTVQTYEYVGATRELFEWLTKVSLTSPFTMKTIAEAMKFASAMGLSIETTKNLTLATGNFAAAMGLGEDHQERIMYNLAQIYQQGKLTGREFRDLAISFVPVYDILGEMAKEAGTSTEAFKKLALEGGVPVEDFFEHFIGYMNTNFPDAMKRMSRTMEGVRNNIKDFIQVVLGMEVLKPVMDNISGRLADVLDKLMSPRTHQIARDFGRGLAMAFDIIAEKVDMLGKAITDTLSAMGFVKPTLEGIQIAFVKFVLNIKGAIDFMAHTVYVIRDAIINYVIPALQSVGLLSKNGEKYGEGFMFNFAKGIIQGVAKFLAKAIIYVTAFIKAIFAPHSPPKVAPEIDKWGAEMMNEWIEGAVNQTDWNALSKGVGDKVSGQLYDLAKPPLPVPGTITTGPEVEPGINAPLAKPIKDAVSNAVNSVTKFVTEQGMKLAAAFMHGFDDAMFDALDAIQSTLKSAISALTEFGLIGNIQGIEMFYDMSMDLIKALDEFNKTGEISQHLLDQISQLGMGLGPEMAKLVKTQFDLAKATKDAAIAQERLNAATRALVAAQNDVRKMVREYNAMLRGGADKATLKIKLREVNASEMAWGAAEKEKQAAEENKKVADERVTQMKELASLQEKLVANMIELLNMQNEAIAAAKGGAGGLSSDLENLGQELSETLSTALEDAFDWEALFKEYEGEISANWDELAKTFGTAFAEALGNTDTQNAANALMTNFKNSIKSVLGMPSADEMLGQMGMEERMLVEQGNKGKSFFQQVVDWIFSGNVDWSKALEKLASGLVKLIEDAAGKLSSEIKDENSNVHKLIFDVGFELGGALLKGFWSGVGSIIGEGGGLDPNSVWNAPQPADMNDWYQQTYGEKPPINIPTIDVQAKVNLVPDDIFSKGEEAGTKGAEGIESGLLEFSWDMTATDLLNLIFQALHLKWRIGSPAKEFIPIGESVVEGIANGITSFVSSIIGPDGAIANAAKDIINAFKEFLGISTDNESTSSIFEDIGGAITQGIANGIQSMDEAIQTAIDWVVSILPDWAKKLLNITSPSKVMMKIGQSAMEGFAIGIMNSADLVKKAAGQVSISPPEMALKKAYYAPSATKSAGVVTKINNVTLGDVYINNNMDWATFKARVQRAITER